MRLQVSIEIMAGMLIALSLALFLSVFMSGEGAVLARNEHTLASIANSVNYSIECALGSFGAGKGG